MSDESNLGESIPLVTEEPQPVFLVGMNGSGTTMLLDSIGRHPDLYGFPQETKMIPAMIQSIDKYGDLRKDENFFQVWNLVCKGDPFVTANHGHPVPVPSNWRAFSRDLPSVLDAVFRYFAAKEGKTRWCEKTPQYVQHIAALHHLFPLAKFVHIIRDGRDCAASINRRYKRTPEYAIFRWKHVVQEGRYQGELLGDKYLQIQYEAITTNPEFWLRQVCDFVGVPFHENILLSRRPKSENAAKPGESKGGLEPNSGKWRTCFSKKQLQRMERIAGSVLAEFDYPIQYEAGDATPSVVRLKYWKWRDFGAEFVAFFNRHWRYQRTKQRKIHWAKLFRRIRVALSQSHTNRY